MVINSTIRMDFFNRGSVQTVDVVQDDKYSRQINFSLYSNGAPWQVPSDAEIFVRYTKADGSGGEYDVFENGENAWSVSGSVISVKVAPQVMTVPGQASLSVAIVQGNIELNTFSIILNVHRNGSSGTNDKEPPVYVTKNLRSPETAQVGQFLEIEEIDPNGRVAKLKAVDKPAGEVMYVNFEAYGHKEGFGELVRCDTRYEDVFEAYENNRIIKAKFNYEVFDLRAVDDGVMLFANTANYNYGKVEKPRLREIYYEEGAEGLYIEKTLALESQIGDIAFYVNVTQDYAPYEIGYAYCSTNTTIDEIRNAYNAGKVVKARLDGIIDLNLTYHDDRISFTGIVGKEYTGLDKNYIYDLIIIGDNIAELYLTEIGSNRDGEGSGLTTAEKSLIISLFKNAAYTADMSATIAQLETLWSGGDVPDVPDTPTGDISATGDEDVVVIGATATDDGDGNVTVIGATAIDDGNGNIIVY